MLLVKFNRNNICLLLLLYLLVIVPASADSYTEKTRLAVFPFKDTQSGRLEMKTSQLLEIDLGKHDFIEIVPLDIESNMIYEMEPSYMWTGIEGGKKQGGILWNIRSEVIEELRAGRDVSYLLFGSMAKTGKQWSLDVYLTRTMNTTPVFSVSKTGSADEEIPEMLKGISLEIADWLKKESVLGEAEEDIRRYMGHMLSHSEVLQKMQKNVSSYPDSIPLRALLLDLYLKEKVQYRDQVMEEGLTIINFFDPSDGKDIRYLLSLNLDPFGVVAEVYEEKKDWLNAIELRNRALKSRCASTERPRQNCRPAFAGLCLGTRDCPGHPHPRYRAIRPCPVGILAPGSGPRRRPTSCPP